MVDDFEYFYIHLKGEDRYQVYAIKTDFFVTYKKKIITTKALSYRNLQQDAYILRIEQKQSFLFLIADHQVRFTNTVAFSIQDIAQSKNEVSKLQDLTRFLNGLIAHISKEVFAKKVIDRLYIHIDDATDSQRSAFDDTTTKNFEQYLEKELHLVCQIIDQKEWYAHIDVNLHRARKFYNIYPNLSVFFGCNLFLVSLFVSGYIFLYWQQGELKQDIKSLEYFYNHTNEDVKTYYELQEQLKAISNDIQNSKERLARLTNSSKAYDVTRVIMDTFISLVKNGVFLETLEIKTEKGNRVLYLTLIGKDEEKLRNYIQTQNYFLVAVDQEDKRHKYKVTKQIRD